LATKCVTCGGALGFYKDGNFGFGIGIGGVVIRRG